MSTTLESVELPDLIERYEAQAVVHGDAILAGAHKAANLAHDELAQIYAELVRRGRDALRSLLPLLEHKNPSVRVWSAAHALAFAPVKSERALRDVQRSVRGLIGFTARMTLRQWRAGELGFP